MNKNFDNWNKMEKRLHNKGSIILSQMRLIDSKRLSHLAGKVTDNELKEIKKKLKELFP